MLLVIQFPLCIFPKLASIPEPPPLLRQYLHPCRALPCETPGSDLCMSFTTEAGGGVDGPPLLCVSSLTQLQCCVLLVLCYSSLSFLSASRIGMSFHCLCPTRALIGPGLPLPTDAAPPTTAQCIQPAAPRDSPRTSLSLFPRSSSLVRRQGRQRENSVGFFYGMNLHLSECLCLTATVSDTDRLSRKTK